MEKPFSCPMSDCSMSFANEDHLTVHKQKHELSLSLTPTTANFKNSFIVDQTPTPTRFLNALELQFQDLQNENPFDATFRRANSTGVSSNLVIPESSSLIASLSDSEELNTPSITLPSEPATPVCLKPNFPKKRSRTNSDNQACHDNTDSLPFTPIEQVSGDLAPQEKISHSDLPSESAHFSSITSSGFSIFTEDDEKSKNKDASKNVLQTSVITSVGNTSFLKTCTVGVPTAVVVSRPAISSISSLSTGHVETPQSNQVKVTEAVPTIVQPLCVAPVVQLMIRLPDGQTVQLPVMASATTTQPTQTIATIAPQVTSTTSNAKIKLKEVLTMNQQSGVTARKSFSSKARARAPVNVLSDDSFDLNGSPPLSPIRTLKAAHHGRKRRDLLDDPDEKRKRSLERNRAAATRCREKRKMWITALEKKADEYARTNAHLQSEVNLLRNEVSHLKIMLLAHKDCPITQQQRASNHEEERDSYTTIRIITPSSDDVQRVPNSSAISPMHSEFMEIEVSSVQSSSDASVTSDTSELSCRER